MSGSYGQAAGAGSTGGRKYTTYGKKTGRVHISSGLSSRDWLAAVVAAGGGSGGETAVNNNDRYSTYSGHNGYRDSPTSKHNKLAESGENPKEARPARRSQKAVIDLTVQSIKKDAEYAKKLNYALNNRNRVISLSSGPDSDVELVRPGQAAKKPAGRKGPSTKRRLVLESPISLGSSSPVKVEQPAPVPFPSMAGTSSPPRSPAPSKQQSASTSTPIAVATKNVPRPTALARKDSNSTAAVKGKETLVEKSEKPNTKGKGSIPREVFAPVAQPQTAPRRIAVPSAPRSPLKQSTTVADPFRFLTSTPRVSQVPASAVSKPPTQSSPSKLQANPVLRGTHLPPPRGHGSDASAAWRRPLTPIIARSTPLKGAQPKRKAKGSLDKVIADIRQKKVRASPTRGKGSFEPIVKKEEDETPVLQAPAEAIQPVSAEAPAREARSRQGTDSSSDLSSLSESTSTSTSGASAKASAVGLNRVVSPLGSATPPVDEASSQASLGNVPASDFAPLLQTCLSISPSVPGIEAAEYRPFTDFVGNCPLLPGQTAQWSKLGEATYSEVFLVSTYARKAKSSKQIEDTIVVKIIPLHMPALTAGEGKGNRSVDGEDIPQTSFAHDVNREIQITQALTRLGGNTDAESSGYSVLKGAYVLKGSYPTALLDCWDSWKRSHRAQCLNPRPDSFGEEQLYAVVCLAHGGSDLETVRLKSWSEAACVLLQVAVNLSQAEQELQFEHRDLHWGNILVAPSLGTEHTLDLADGRGSPLNKLPSCFAQAQKTVDATIIDFTLSRATLPGRIGTVAGGFEDEALFDGSGDYQFDCYRLMRQLNHGDWKGYRPSTNVVWLHYLVLKLLKEKKLKKPSARAAAAMQTARAASPVARGRTRGRQQRPVASKAASIVDQSVVAERHCYEALIAAEEILKAAVDAAIQAAEARKAKAAGVSAGAAGAKNKRKSDTSDEDEDLLFRSAGDFVEWWRNE